MLLDSVEYYWLSGVLLVDGSESCLSIVYLADKYSLRCTAAGASLAYHGQPVRSMHDALGRTLGRTLYNSTAM
jgi:hypothetical protein